MIKYAILLAAVVVTVWSCGSIKIGGGKGKGKNKKCDVPDECPCRSIPMESELAAFVIIDGEPVGTTPEPTTTGAGDETTTAAGTTTGAAETTTGAAETTTGGGETTTTGDSSGSSDSDESSSSGSSSGSGSGSGGKYDYPHDTEAEIEVEELIEYLGLEGTISCKVKGQKSDQWYLEFDASEAPDVTLTCTNGYWDGQVTVGDESFDLQDVKHVHCQMADEEGSSGGSSEEETTTAAADETTTPAL